MTGPESSPQAQAPLDYFERMELSRLRECALRVAPTTDRTERGELRALRGALERELAELRAVTETDCPLMYAALPISELLWRRPLAQEKRRAQRQAKEAEARRRFQAEEAEARHRIQASELAARMAQAHTVLTAAERREQEALRKDWAAHDALGDESEMQPIYSCPGDCGRKHLSLSAAAACANVRGQVTAAEAPPRARSKVAPRRSHLSRPAAPAPKPRAAPSKSAPIPPTRLATVQPLPAPRGAARSSAPPRRSSPGVILGPGPVAVPERREPVPAPRPRSGPEAVPAAREPVPGPPCGTSSQEPTAAREPVPAPPPVSSRQASILATVRASPVPLSANAIVTAVGGRKSAMLDEVRLLVRVGLLVPTGSGFIVVS